MGTWGYKSFENDGAADWLYDLEEATQPQFLLSVLRAAGRAGGKTDLDDALEGLAAAEVLAGARYEPPRNLPRIARSWIKRVALVPKDSDLMLAIRAVEKIGRDSELLDSWQEAGKLAAWQKEIEQLSRRLTVALGVPVPVRQLKPKVQRETLAEFIIAVATGKAASRREELQKKLATLSNPNRPVGGKWEGETLNRLTPLHWVASRGLVPEARLLLAKGADVNGAMPLMSFMAPPITFAMDAGHTEMVALLLEAGADRQKALDSAIANDQVDMMKLIMTGGLDLNSKTKGGWTPVLWAAYHGSVNALKLLLKSGAKVDCADKDGDTPLHLAAAGPLLADNVEAAAKFYPVVKLLVENGAKLNVTSFEGKTPLDCAEEVRAQGIVKYLRQRGARNGKTKPSG
jgi:hypothetical protein